MITELERTVASAVIHAKKPIDAVNCCIELHGTDYDFMQLHDTMKALWTMKLRGELDYQRTGFKSNSKTLSLFDKEQPCKK